MELVYIFIGIALGSISIFLVFNTKLKYASKESKQLQIDLEENEREIESLQLQFEEKQNLIRDWERKYLNLESEVKITQNELELRKQNFKEQEEKQEEIQKQFKAEFKNLASDILEEKSKSFSEKSQKSIEVLLNPLRTKIEEFKTQIRDTYEKETRERFSLGEEIKRLSSLNNQLTTDAQNLTKALKGDSKIQGDWGEMILENILEQSGLTKGREYLVQETYDNAEGRKLRPDVIVRYPGNRCVVIDSKVSLTNYEQYVSAQDHNTKEDALKLHVASVTKHIKELSAKNYQDLLVDCKSPDFVMMFLPIEPAYLLAIHNSPDLWQDAYKKKVLLISPTNLIAALRMIAELWNQDKQNKNVAEIAEESGKLYDKFVGFLEDMNKIEKAINNLSSSYTEARKKIETGTGNLIGRAEKIKKLGAKQKKSIPASFMIAQDKDEIEFKDHSIDE
ncbi:MAG: DNA recombination protein RmuC [Bacteroidetes bacterium]|nr:MAG: DNA recombination protein RmuC [Bacteroidota bacterium]